MDEWINEQVLVDNVSVTQPAVRSVVVWVDCCDGKVRHGVLPVLALYARREHAYYRAADSEDLWEEELTQVYRSHRELRAAGYHLEESGVHVSPLVPPERGVGLVMPEERDWPVQLIACPWPSGEDDARLAGVIADLRQRAEERYRRERTERARAAEVN